MTNDAPMSLDDDVQSVDAPVKDVDGIPYCRLHHVRMKNASGGRKGSPTKYYACPVSGCEEKEQVIKTARPGVVPNRPQECPRCSKTDGKRRKPVYCERDPAASTPASVILKCPCCGWKSSAFAVPQLAAAQFARGRSLPPVESIGDR